MMGRIAARLLGCFLAVTCSVAGCSDEGEGAQAVDADADDRSFVVAAPHDVALAVGEMLRATPIANARVVETDAPAGQLGGKAGLRAAVVVGGGRCGDCYRISGANNRFTIEAGGLLGAQYGVAHLLEEAGVRFYHPFAARLPDGAELGVPDTSPAIGVEQAPEVGLRGLHLHTLHPVESYFAFWEPGEKQLEQAKQIIDWTVKNRGNYVQWPALDQIVKEPESADAWRKHTRAIVDYAHARGVKVGINVQLFGTSSLQKSFILLPKAGLADAEQRIHDQLTLLLADLPFDKLCLSFGEFSGADPASFVASVDLARKGLEEVLPSAELTTSVHVGNSKKLRVSYMGEELLYYFLVKFCDPRVVPWVHTVMYYDLFEDAGGAYEHEDFSEHRAFLLDRLAKGQRVGYHPESAYWVAFDNPVPTYAPLYVRSRWLDYAKIRESASATPGSQKLDEHVLFSSGWEWGYWQNDYATLRMGYKLPESASKAVDEMLAPLSPELAGAVNDLTEAQHEGLLVRRLAAYLAGRDVLIDVGVQMGIVSQPVRPDFKDVAKRSSAEKADFRAQVVEPLSALEKASAAALARGKAAFPAGSTSPDRFAQETLDGLEIDALRARFARATWSLASAEGEPDQALLAEVDEALSAAEVVVARRQAAFYWPEPSKLTETQPNSTLYGYGYLREAQSLCFWKRERAQLRNALLGESNPEGACVL